MQPAKKTELYKSGFAKDLTRGKHNLLINERLKNARNARKLTLSQTIIELDKRGFKLSMASLQGYEANENSVNHRYPSITALLALSSLYGCSTDYIFGISDELSREGHTDLKARFEYEPVLTWDGEPINKVQQGAIASAINNFIKMAKHAEEMD